MTMNPAEDWRNIRFRRRITGNGYADQPYLIKTEDGAWLCCTTVSAGEEGAEDQHVQTMRSFDQGRSWCDISRPEEPGSPENSYAVLYKTGRGRIYLFYNHNTDNVREVLCHDGIRKFDRVDSLGHYVFRFSDDHGRSWSPQRYEIPVREFQCDRDNIYGGRIRFFWNVGKPFSRQGTVFVPLHKVGQMGTGFFQQSEGVLLASPNLETEPDPEKIRWDTLPDGDTGLRMPPGGGPVADEQNCVVLSDGSICCSYRGIDGYAVEAYSRDGGHTFEQPHCKQYYDGRPLKNPRACNVVWPYAPGRYLFWFHNHGGPFIPMLNETDSPEGLSPYSDRNPAWICGGTEVRMENGLEIRWGNPQILLYDENPSVRMSYPDFMADSGKYFVTETQKSIAGIHEIPKSFLERLFVPDPGTRISGSVDGRIRLDDPRILLPKAPLQIGFTVQSDHPGVWCRAWNKDRLGCEFGLDEERRLCLRWICPQESAYLQSERLPQKIRQAVFTLDPMAGILSFSVNGVFCDGGTEKQFGWQRFSKGLVRLSYTESGIVDQDRIRSMDIFAGTNVQFAP